MPDLQMLTARRMQQRGGFVPPGRGMGDIVELTRPRAVGSGVESSGHSTRDAIFGAIGASLQTINLWVATRNGGLIQQQPYTGQTYATQQGLAPGQAIGEGIGTGFSNFAAQFGVSPTTLVILGIAGFYLLTRK